VSCELELEFESEAEALLEFFVVITTVGNVRVDAKKPSGSADSVYLKVIL